MKDERRFLIVEIDALPEVFVKVVEAKRLLEKGKLKTVSEAVNVVGISRSAFYKYRDSVFPFYENKSGKTVTLAFDLDDRQGLLSDVLNVLATARANILTINQTIPINKIANITLTLETGKMSSELLALMQSVESINGVGKIKIIAI